MATKKITKAMSKKYLEDSGRCPFCGSDNIEGGSLEVDGHQAWQEVTCLDCDGGWDDIYKLVGIDNSHNYPVEEK